MTQRHDAAGSAAETDASRCLSRDRDRGDRSMVPLFIAAAAALLVLVVLIPVVTVVGALLGFMAAAHIG